MNKTSSVGRGFGAGIFLSPNFAIHYASSPYHYLRSKKDMMKRKTTILAISFLLLFSLASMALAEGPDPKMPAPMHPERSQNELESVWLVEAPVVDGELGEWSGQTKLALNGRTAPYPGGTESLPDADLSAWTSVIWTSDRVYVAISVKDDYVVTNARPWQHNDMAGIVFDVDQSGTFSPGDIDMTLRPDNRLTVNGGWPAGYEWASKETSTGWQGELSIPMSQFGGVDFLGNVKVGFTWGVQDNDGIGVESWLSWAGSDFYKGTPENDTLTFTNGPVRKWVAFHNGVDGYNGITDSTLDGWHAAWRYGDRPELTIYARNQYHLITKFEIPDLGPNVRVLDAKIHVKLTGRNHDWNCTVKAYRVLRPWDEATVTWNEAAAGQRWTRTGADGIGTDRESRRIGIQLFDTLGWKTIDLANDVAVDMYEHPENNHGIILRAEDGSSVYYQLASSEARTEDALWFEVYAEFPPGQAD
jgi:hypothetical protein